MPPRMPASPNVRRCRPPYTVASNGTYTVSPMLARPNQGGRHRDSAARILSRHRAERAARVMFMGDDLNERLVIVASQ
ncbi:hypothetical protein EMIT0158MI4_10403 [Burkholderia ambifaria]